MALTRAGVPAWDVSMCSPLAPTLMGFKARCAVAANQRAATMLLAALAIVLLAVVLGVLTLLAGGG